jgi:hypothetical protein
MESLGVFAWIGIGAAAGWTVTRLMVGAENDALRGTAAGMLGAVLGGLGLRLLDPSPVFGATPLNTSAAALAGALWMTWITCVVTSGRRRDARPPAPEIRLRRSDVVPGFDQGRPVLSYTAARDQLVDQLLRDAMAHEAERYDEVGRRFDSVERVLPHGGEPELGKLRVALTFWDGWIDARDSGWRSEDGIAKTDWPLLARIVAADLEGDRDVTDARVVTRFDAAAFRHREAACKASPRACARGERRGGFAAPT